MANFAKNGIQQDHLSSVEMIGPRSIAPLGEVSANIFVVVLTEPLMEI